MNQNLVAIAGVTLGVVVVVMFILIKKYVDNQE